MERIETNEQMDSDEQAKLFQLFEDGFYILELAAREIGASK
jgi:hypothetical protein